MSPISIDDIKSIAPLLTIMITGMVVLMVDLALPRGQKTLVWVLSYFGILVAGGLCITLWGADLTGFDDSIAADKFALLFQLILLVVLALSIGLSVTYIQIKNINHGEYFALLLFSTSGAMIMATSRELITIFVGLEVLSIALYILTGFARTEKRSEEAALKYFLLGAFSSGFFLYGIALIYGGAGTTRLDLFPASALTSPYTVAGMAMLIIGLGFKAAVVPFHSWTPDVYEGAPTSVTAFMSAGAKGGAFAAFIRIASVLLHTTSAYVPALWTLAVLTVIVGNVLAVQQTNLKRMLAYSSIAHAGYILIGLLARNAEGNAGVLFYILAYTFMNLGAFGVLIMLARRGRDTSEISDLRGLADVDRPLAVLMTIFMLSLAGIPGTAGFMGKLFLFYAAIHSGLYGLAVIGLLASVVGAYYYLRVIVVMFFQPAEREFPSRLWGFAPGVSVVLVVCAVFTLFLGVSANGLYSAARQGADSLHESDSTSSQDYIPINSSQALPVGHTSVVAQLPRGLNSGQ